MSNKDTEIKSRYEDYSVEELQKAFKAAFLSSSEFSDADIEELDQIVDVLKRKHPVPRKFTTEESWKDFLKNHSEDFARIGIQNTEEVMKEGLETVAARMPVQAAAVNPDVGATPEVTVAVKADAGASCDDRKPRKCYHKWKHTALVAAAVVMIMVLITVTAAAAGIDLWSWVPVWNDSTFQFVPEDSAPVTSLDIPAALKQLGVEEPLFPTWLPEGFVLDELKIHMEDPLLVFVSYLCENNAITISIRALSEEYQPIVLEKDDSDSVQYSTYGIDHYISSNNRQSTASWITNGYQVKISGHITFNEMKTMIDSVYCEVE